MWRIYTFIAYLLLALLIPVALAALSIRRKTKQPRRVACPRDGDSAFIGLDSWHALRMHLAGNPEVLVGQCSRWPQYAGCRQDCRGQLPDRL